jgi:hypothetical protein
MALSKDRHTREYESYVLNDSGETAIRTKGEGVFKPSGLNVEGKLTQVTLNTSTWVALPTTALANRNAISILNTSTDDILIQYDNAAAFGLTIGPDEERQYDITDAIIIYGKATVGTPTILIEELA